jgi:hypothetical protein
VSNLIGNALKHGVGTVSVRAEEEDADALVSVHNDGPPIAADLMPLIFNPFERGTQNRQGLGLGLYIVQEIVKGHQGEISVTSSAGAGTTFSVRLPRPAPAMPSSTAPHRGGEGLSPLTVVVRLRQVALAPLPRAETVHLLTRILATHWNRTLLISAYCIILLAWTLREIGCR